MFLRNGKLFNINVQHVFDGVQFPPNFFADQEARDNYNIIEVADPVWPNSVFDNAVQQEDGSLQITPRTIEDVKRTMQRMLASLRYTAEIRGITYNEAFIDTDREHRYAFAEELRLMELSSTPMIDWKTSKGWLTLTASVGAQILLDINAHVQQCYSLERTIYQQIENISDVNVLRSLNLNDLYQII